MKITKVEVFEVQTRRPAWRPILCRIYTDEGVYGIAPTELELAGVSAQVVPALAAQQLVDRHVERLALDVPQGDVQGGDAGKDDGLFELSLDLLVGL